jgi:hypothetical protein
MLALGVYPDIPLERARARHENARRLLLQDIDPSTRKKEVRFGRSDAPASEYRERYGA